jgi:ABC-2 type transport system permease protein
VDPYLETGRASIAVVVPRGFGDRLTAGRQADLQVIADGSEANSATVGLGYASAIVGRYSQNVVVRRLNRPGPQGSQPARVTPEVRVWYNPELKSRNFMIPGILGLLLMVLTTMLTSLAIVKEKEIGTMEQLAVTPIRPYKLAPFTLIGLADILLILLVATFWFHVPVRGSVPLLLGLCAVFLMTTLGLGLFVSTISRTQQQAMMTSVFFVMFPMNFLSGFIFPIENMPAIFQYGAYLIPLRHFLVILRGLFLKGVGIEDLWDEALMMSVLGVALLTLSVLRFRKKLG